MRETGVTERTLAEGASPAVFVPNKDGTLGFFVDYRKLNRSSMGLIFISALGRVHRIAQ